MKCLFALASAAMLAAPSVPRAQPYAHDPEAIVKVSCNGGWGTAVKVGPSSYITAAHVIDAGGCKVDGFPITVTAINAFRDYATFIGPTTNHVITPSCDGFRAGRIYVARGYAGGFEANVAVPWLATELTDGGQALFLGDAIPGMSGGPLVDRKGRVVGIVNRRVASRSIPLELTPLCP
jgi:hypothetical protein